MKATISINELKKICHSFFEHHLVPEEIADTVIEDLLASDMEGCHSHGIMRLEDMAKEIENGRIVVDNLPIAEPTTNTSSVVNGNNSFGTLSLKEVEKEIKRMLDTQSVCAVALKNSNHVGRLFRLGHSLCQNDIIVIGFLNYRGAGQKIPVWKGQKGRFNTNPILVGIPKGDGNPIVLDMTTSNVSEGEVRISAYQDDKAHPGWLIDKLWNPVDDSSKLYSSPENTMIAPLGGDFGYKGFGLALVAEILAGIIAGGGYAREGDLVGGNGGLFIALKSDAFSRTKDVLNHEIEHLLKYCEIGKDYKNNEANIPGEQSATNYKKALEEGKITLPKVVYDKIMKYLN